MNVTGLLAAAPFPVVGRASAGAWPPKRGRAAIEARSHDHRSAANNTEAWIAGTAPLCGKKKRKKNETSSQTGGKMADYMKYLSLALLFPLVLASGCSAGNGGGRAKGYSERRSRMEAEAQDRLATARGQLADGQAAEAKRTIERMRSDCYLALDGRAEGILLMDSVDLFLAKSELSAIDSLMCAGDSKISRESFEEACRKVQFYERKIQYDRSR